jgi:hypothetical protein
MGSKTYEKTMNTLQSEIDTMRADRMAVEAENAEKTEKSLVKMFEQRREQAQKNQPKTAKKTRKTKQAAQKDANLFHEAGHIARVYPVSNENYVAYVDGMKSKPGHPKMVAKTKAEKLHEAGERARVIPSSKGYRVLEGGLRERDDTK